jgi:hypothetical protein
MTTAYQEGSVTKMKPMLRRIAIITALLTIAVLFVSCNNLVKLTYDNGKLIDEKNNITYLTAPICFEPAVTAAEPYAKCSKLKITLYEIKGQDVSQWLAESYDVSGAVYYAESIQLPSLEEFDADLIHICIEQTITAGIAKVTDKEAVESVISAFINGEPCPIVQSGSSFQLKFESKKYAGIFYNLIYVEGDDGENYIYDRSTQTCVNVGDVLQEYLPRPSAR